MAFGSKQQGTSKTEHQKQKIIAYFSVKPTLLADTQTTLWKKGKLVNSLILKNPFPEELTWLGTCSKTQSKHKRTKTCCGWCISHQTEHFHQNETSLAATTQHKNLVLKTAFWPFSKELSKLQNQRATSNSRFYTSFSCHERVAAANICTQNILSNFILGACMIICPRTQKRTEPGLGLRQYFPPFPVIKKPVGAAIKHLAQQNSTPSKTHFLHFSKPVPKLQKNLALQCIFIIHTSFPATWNQWQPSNTTENPWLHFSKKKHTLQICPNFQKRPSLALLFHHSSIILNQ